MIGCSSGKLSFSNICRLCMRHEGAMSSIFTDDRDGIIPHRILYCLSLKVFVNDGLPVLICAQCIYQLNCSFKFKTQCENSDAILRKYLSNIQFETEIKKEYQDEASRYNDMIKRDEDSVTSSSVAASKQLLETNNPNQEQANVKLENADEMPYVDDAGWNSSESATEVSVDVNQYGTSNEGEQEDGVNMINDSIQITAFCNEEEKTNRNDVTMGFTHSATTISVFKNTVNSSKEARIKVKMKEQKRTLKSSFSSKKIYVNEVCSMLVTSETNQNPKKPYTCQLCFQSYAGRSGLWQHLQKHSGRQYVCKMCNKHFTRGNVLKQHERTHLESSSGITCLMCKKTFLNILELKRHELDHIIDRSNAQMYT